MVARRLGLNPKTLDTWMAWREATALAPKIVPVVVEPTRSTRRFSLELGPGRVTGLELEDVVELLRRIG